MEKYKTKIIQADLGIFTHIHAYSDIFKHKQTYPGIITTYSDMFRTLCNPGIFRTLVYCEYQYIQNQKHIQNRGIFRVLVYSRNSRPVVFLGEGILKIYNKFREEHPYRSVISIKLQSYFIEIARGHGYSPVYLMHVFRTPCKV